MNIYYYKRVHLDIPHFWNEICKMSIVPTLLAIVGLYLLSRINITNLLDLLLGIFSFIILYIPLTWKFSMNDYERNLFSALLKRVVIRK